MQTLKPSLVERSTVLLRLGAGARAVPAQQNLRHPIEVYEFEGCPFCRKVREAISHLDLDALMFPCPKEGTRFRPRAVAQSGLAQFPFMVDPNNGTSLQESDAIVNYLYTQYAHGAKPVIHRLGRLNNVTTGLSSALRRHRGTYSRASRPPQQPLELFAFEPDPASFAIREALSSLELPWFFRNNAPGARAHDPARNYPRLRDDNTGCRVVGTASIVDYLEARYAI